MYTVYDDGKRFETSREALSPLGLGKPQKPNPWITKSTSGGFFFSTSFRRVSTVFFLR